MNIITYLWNYHKFKRAFYGLTLNSIGPVYGVQRNKGESHRKYERRILKVACRRGPIQLYGKMVSDGIKEGIADIEKGEEKK